MSHAQPSHHSPQEHAPDASAHTRKLRPAAPLKRALEHTLTSTPVGDLTLRGYSRAADATSFVVPELGWMFDAGILVDTMRPDHVWISHTHTDHVHMLTHVKSRRKPPDMYAPAHAPPLIDGFLWHAQQLTHSEPFEPDFALQEAYRLHPMTPGQSFDLPRGREALRVRVVRCDHTVPAIGCLLEIVRQKLKPELIGTPGEALGRLRREGVEIMESHAQPILAYLYDTTPRVFEAHPEVLAAPYILTECSFFDPEHAEQAVKTGHTHWQALEPWVREHPGTTFVLGHLSKRYSDAQILEGFVRHLPDNAIAWVEL